VKTANGEVYSTDLVYLCSGFVPNSEMLQEHMSHALDAQHFITVNKFLQVEPYPNIFAIGDVTNADTEKLAGYAMIHASLVAKNIIALEQKLESSPILSAYIPFHQSQLIMIGQNNSLEITADGQAKVGGFLKAKIKQKMSLSYNLVKFGSFRWQ